MELLSGVLLLLIIILALISGKEKVDCNDQKFLIPFYKTAKWLINLSAFESIFNKWVNSMYADYSLIYGKKEAKRQSYKKCMSILAKSILIITVFSFLALIIGVSQTTDFTKSLTRKDAGCGSVTYELIAEIEDEKRSIPIKVEEREYTKEEVDELFDYGCENIRKLILGENKSLNEVTKDLNLLTYLPDSEIEISWECDNYSLIEPSGHLRIENLTSEGKKICLTAVFSYADYTRREDIDVVVMKEVYEGVDGKFSALEDLIKDTEASGRSNYEYLLPTEILGEKVTYTEKQSSIGSLLLVLAVVIVCLLPFEEKALVNKKKQDKDKCLLLEYPELVCKLSLYLGAGLTINKAWEKISLSYIEGLGKKAKKSYCNEEVVYTYRQMESGVLKQVAFEDFGNRCRLQSYKKLSLLIISNIKKGSSDLSDILSIETREAFENRKSQVIKLAGEASAKLMLPMILELVVVVGILIIPAFTSINI